MTNTQTNTLLESVSKTKDQLRNFNDLKKEDVITSVQMLKVSKNINDAEMIVYASADIEDKQFSLYKEKLESKKREYEDSDSDASKSLNNEFELTLRCDAEAQIDIRKYTDTVSIDTELKEISVDEAVRSFDEYSLSLKNHKDVTDIDKNTLLSRLSISRNDYSIELVLKDNVETFVLVKKEKSVLDEIRSLAVTIFDNQHDQYYCLKTFYEQLHILSERMRNKTVSLEDKIKCLSNFFEAYDYDLDHSYIYMMQEDSVKHLRNLFIRLKQSKTESINQ